MIYVILFALVAGALLAIYNGPTKPKGPRSA